MTKKVQSKKEEKVEVAVLPTNDTVEIKYNTDILLEKILDACLQMKKSIDDLGKRFGGGY